MSRDSRSDGSKADAAGRQAGVALRRLSAADWAAFGVPHLAYIRPVLVNGVRGMSIHVADGTPIGAAPDARLAMAAIRQHDMEPMWTH